MASSPCRSLLQISGPEAEAVEKDKQDKQQDASPPQGRPRVFNHISIAGEHERKLYPTWPDRAFRIPDDIPYGTIYYIRKGSSIGFGTTARVEKVPEGHVIKTPNANPYDRREEAGNLQGMRTEAAVYNRLGAACPYVPKMLEWDPVTACLSLEYIEHGSLDLYIQGKTLHGDKETRSLPITITPDLRRRWALQTTRGLCALHAVGVVHADLTPRNLLLDAGYNVRIADFAGSSVDGAPYTVCAGERYVAPGWSFRKTPTPADDLFLLGGVLYAILTGTEPHHDVADQFDVAKLYAAGTFPDVSGLACGAVIHGCWAGTWPTAAAVLEALLAAFRQDNDPLQ